MQKKSLILIELNEINFSYVKKYVDYFPSKFPTFKYVLEKFNHTETFSEKEYSLLEPWIQWMSAHTNKTFSEHQVFRLGDSVKYKSNFIFEEIEKLGYSVGCISPMNVKNNLKNPSYFIPDPWTKTEPSKDFWSKNLYSLIAQTVNDNSKGKITLKSYLVLIFSLLRFASIRNYGLYLWLGLTSIKHKWRKALFLDLLLSDCHKQLYSYHRPSFSTVFFNAGAHIQHHYFHNSRFCDSDVKNPKWYVEPMKDPFFEMLLVYESALKSHFNSNNEIIICTGLSQIPHIEPIFYYRLKNHDYFLNLLGVRYTKVLPRMTRDFLIEFSTNCDRDNCYNLLDSLKVNNQQKCFELIDRREKSLFVTLTYPKEVLPSTYVIIHGEKVKFHQLVVFVAIKNGEHCDQGSLFSSFYNPSKNDKTHIKELYNIVLNYFGNSKKTSKS